PTMNSSVFGGFKLLSIWLTETALPGLLGSYPNGLTGQVRHSSLRCTRWSWFRSFQEYCAVGTPVDESWSPVGLVRETRLVPIPSAKREYEARSNVVFWAPRA